MASEVSREVGAAIRWLIVGVAVGVLPTYVIMNERGKKESSTAANVAASAAAASVYAAWNAAPKPVCPAPPITMPTVEAVTGSNGGRAAKPTRVAANGNAGAPAAKPDEAAGGMDEAQMMMPMLNMMQGMMNDNGGGGSGGSTPDMNELMKQLPKK